MNQHKLFPAAIAQHRGRLFLLLFACLAVVLTLTYPYEKPRDNNTPSYITHLWPAPNDDVWGFWYDIFLAKNIIGDPQCGISLRLSTPNGISELERLDKYDSNNKFPRFSERVVLYLDGNLLSNANRIAFENLVGELRDNEPGFRSDLSAGYFFNWPVSLKSGKHTAKLSIATRSGEVLEYEWAFTIK